MAEENRNKRAAVYKKRKRPHRWGLLAAVVVVLAVLAGAVWHSNESSPGFYLVPLDKEGSALTIWAIDEDGPIGCPVIKKKQWGSRMYQRLTGAYLEDDTYVIYASDEYADAYNQYHDTDYTCFVLEETPQGSFRFKGSHSRLYPYNSPFMDCYWEEYSDEGGGIYYKNAATGHRLSVQGESVFKAHR